MGRENVLLNNNLILPASFFDQLMRDIPVATWIRLIESNPSLKETLLEGFSGKANKLAALMRQPQLQARLRRFLQSEKAFLESILEVWGQEQLPVVAFLEMLDKAFVRENFSNIKDFLGPERFFAGLFILGYFEESVFFEHISEGFWERQIVSDLVEILVPVWSLWQEFVLEYPQARDWLEGLIPPLSSQTNFEASRSDSKQTRGQSHKEEERRRKLEQKIEKAREEQSLLQEQLARQRRENEELKKKVTEFESEFESRVQEAVTSFRNERFERYQKVDEHPLEEAAKHIDSLIKRADRAFELQRQADEQFGLISTVRQKLIQVELYLKEIERIYADSLVVHSEVAKAKDGLLQERKRLLELPGIEKILSRESDLKIPSDLRRSIRLIDIVPENLPKITKAEKLVLRLASLGLIEDPAPLKEDIRTKKRQILEALYACFAAPPKVPSSSKAFRSLDDFVSSGHSKGYDVYIDGYNILLKVERGRKATGSTSLTAFREEFIEAVYQKSHSFRKIYMVFDGVEEFRDRRGNMEIIYTDKSRGSTADSTIIEALRKRADGKIVLVTADQEIIRATQSHVFGLIDPRHFYTFIFDLNLP